MSCPATQTLHVPPSLSPRLSSPLFSSFLHTPVLSSIRSSFFLAMFVLFSFVAFVTSSFPFPSLPSFLHSIYPFMHPYFHPLNTITMPCTFMHPYSHSYTSIFYSQLSAGCMYWRSTVGVRERATMLHLTQPPSNITLHHTSHPPTHPPVLACRHFQRPGSA